MPHALRDVQIQCAEAVDPAGWNELAASLGGAFFHGHDFATHTGRRSGVEVLFVTAHEAGGSCVGVAICSITSPRNWPFSKACRVAVLEALPATADGDVDLKVEIMARLEAKLRRRGVCRLEVRGKESPHSREVLTSLSYELTPRCEFYVDLTAPTEDIWKSLSGARRRSVRKARKMGVETRAESSEEGLRALESFHLDSMQRRGIDQGAGLETASHRELVRGEGSTLLVSYSEGQAINAALFVGFAGRLYYAMSGSSSEGNRLRGPSHVVWAMIEMAKEDGATTLNLGGVMGTDGGMDETDGLYRFKHQFGSRAVEQPSGTKRLGILGPVLEGGLSLLRRLRDRHGARGSRVPDASTP